jgi:TonB family protein
VLIPERPVSRWPFATSVLLHLLAVAALAYFVRIRHIPVTAEAEVSAPIINEDWITHLVFIPTITSSSPGGGGGGGGNQQPGPIRKAEGRGTDTMTLRIAKPISPSVAPIDAEPELPGVVLDAKPLASGNAEVVGLPMGGVPYGTSQGPGSGGGVGTGRGTGIGSGEGPGVGPGSGGGMGGGVYRAGSGGVSAPTVIHEVRPSYPPESLRARIQGAVVLNLVVTTDGLPADIRVARSLAPDLDQAAIEAVQQWRFRPGRRGDTPVNVLVTVMLEFSIR